MRLTYKGNVIEASIHAFNFWEIGCIGMDIKDKDNGEFVEGYDIPIKEAKQLVSSLQTAIAYYDEIEAIAESEGV